MKGIVLAGGTGSRFSPLNRATNKHLLPVYNLPMVFYPIQILRNIGIDDILIITGGPNGGDFLRVLQNGEAFGMKHLQYAYEEGDGSLAAELSLAETFAEGEPICVVMGDNVIEGNVCAAAERFRRQRDGAHIILKEGSDPERSACPEIANGRILGIEKKPKRPKSTFAITGIYFYDATFFDKIQQRKTSQRVKLEITDINNMYLEEGTLTYSVLDGWWTHIHTIDSLLLAANRVEKTGANKLADLPRSKVSASQ